VGADERVETIERAEDRGRVVVDVMPRTVNPVASNARTVAEPMPPAEPVTTAVVMLSG
jgi:hypothetical protein